MNTSPYQLSYFHLRLPSAIALLWPNQITALSETQDSQGLFTASHFTQNPIQPNGAELNDT